MAGENGKAKRTEQSVALKEEDRPNVIRLKGLRKMARENLRPWDPDPDPEAWKPKPISKTDRLRALRLAAGLPQ